MGEAGGDSSAPDPVKTGRPELPGFSVVDGPTSGARVVGDAVTGVDVEGATVDGFAVEELTAADVDGVPVAPGCDEPPQEAVAASSNAPTTRRFGERTGRGYRGPLQDPCRRRHRWRDARVIGQKRRSVCHDGARGDARGTECSMYQSAMSIRNRWRLFGSGLRKSMVRDGVRPLRHCETKASTMRSPFFSTEGTDQSLSM